MTARWLVAWGLIAANWLTIIAIMAFGRALGPVGIWVLAGLGAGLGVANLAHILVSMVGRS